MLRFSIVIPTRNRPEWLSQVLEAALEQDFQDFEAVIIDNSDDRETATEAVVKRINSPKVRFLSGVGRTFFSI